MNLFPSRQASSRDEVHVSSSEKRQQIRDQIAEGRIPKLPPLESSIFDQCTRPTDSVVSLALSLGIDMPKDAIDLFPMKVGPRVIHFPRTNQILKIGPGVTEAEANAMCLLSSETTVPVPHVFAALESAGSGFILMSMIRGQPLRKAWPLPPGKRARVLEQLRGHVGQWRSLQGDYYGGVGGHPCKDVFFNHIRLHDDCNPAYGPFKTRSEYNSGLHSALISSRPGGRLRANDPGRLLMNELGALNNDAKILTHGDLHPGNIMIDEDGVSGIIDWGQSGFSISEREYFESRSRSRDSDWDTLLDQLFQADTLSGLYPLLEGLNNELVRFSGI